MKQAHTYICSPIRDERQSLLSTDHRGTTELKDMRPGYPEEMVFIQEHAGFSPSKIVRCATDEEYQEHRHRLLIIKAETR